MVSKLLEGESLSDRIRREGGLSEDAEAILRYMLDALAVAHRAGAIHRDVKPASIFLGKPGKDGQRRVLLPDLLELGERDLAAVTRAAGTSAAR